MEAFIKLFKSPRGYYFFDVNKDTVVNISRDCYDYLNGQGDLSKCEREYNALKEQGYLSNYHTKVLKHPETDNLEDLLDSGMSTLILQVTQSCNLCCSYCPYANSIDPQKFRSHSSKTMSLETAKKAIDFLAAHSSDCDNITISFYGGEPLIAFPLIVECVDYAEEIFEGKNLYFSLTTNATLFKDEMMEFFIEHRFGITFSMDGPKHIHDKNRKRIDGSPTYDVVMSKMKKFSEMCPKEYFEDNVFINVVADPEDNLADIDEWVKECLPSDMHVSCSVYEDDDLENKKYDNTYFYNEKFQYLVALELMNHLEIVKGLRSSNLVNAYMREFVSGYTTLKNEKNTLPEVGVPTAVCVSGIKKLFVNVDGTFYPCEKVNEVSETMKIGSLDSGLNYENIRNQINLAQITPEECINCWAQRHCDICQKFIADGDHLSAEKKLNRCDGTRDTFMQVLKCSVLMKESCTLYKN